MIKHIKIDTVVGAFAISYEDVGGIIYKAFFVHSNDSSARRHYETTLKKAVENLVNGVLEYPSLQLSQDLVVVKISSSEWIARRPHLVYGFVQDFFGNLELSSPLHTGLITVDPGLHDYSYINGDVFKLLRCSALRVVINNNTLELDWLDGIVNPYVTRLYLKTVTWVGKIRHVVSMMSRLPALEELVYDVDTPYLDDFVLCAFPNVVVFTTQGTNIVKLSNKRSACDLTIEPKRHKTTGSDLYCYETL